MTELVWCIPLSVKLCSEYQFCFDDMLIACVAFSWLSYERNCGKQSS